MARAGDPPVLLVKWYDLSKWLLERVESFPKSQRFVFGQSLADRSLAILETLVDAAWSPPGPRKAGLLARAIRELEVLRWLLRMAETRRGPTTTSRCTIRRRAPWRPPPSAIAWCTKRSCACSSRSSRAT